MTSARGKYMVVVAAVALLLAGCGQKGESVDQASAQAAVVSGPVPNPDREVSKVHLDAVRERGDVIVLLDAKTPAPAVGRDAAISTAGKFPFISKDTPEPEASLGLLTTTKVGRVVQEQSEGHPQVIDPSYKNRPVWVIVFHNVGVPSFGGGARAADEGQTDGERPDAAFDPNVSVSDWVVYIDAEKGDVLSALSVPAKG